MRQHPIRSALAALFVLALTACGGGGDGSPNTTPPPSATLQQKIAAAAADAANDSATNAGAPFTVLQGAGVPAVVVKSPPKVNFTVFTDGAVKTGLTASNVSLIISKLVPGTGGQPDEWQTYTHRTRAALTTCPANATCSDAVRATLTTPAFASIVQPAVDPKQTDPALAAAQLVWNADGYYTYTFTTDITDPTKTAGVVFERERTHRVAIQLNYVNAAGETVRVNPYFDFTIDADGNAVAVTDPALTRKMTDVSSCNSCHEKLALHGGGRVDTQLCVMCHNNGLTDPNSGNVLTLSTMVHKIHSAKLLKSKLATGGEIYTVRSDDFSEVGFPQDLRNCTKCHSGDNPKTPQGDNWKTAPSKQACLTCHANKTGSKWETRHTVFAQDPLFVGAGATAKDLTDPQCADCHRPGSNIAPERVHWNQNEEHAAKYKMNIESVDFVDTPDRKGRSVTVKYYLSDPTNGDAAYNLVTAECTGTTAAPVCANTTKFGNLRFFLAYQNLVGQSTAVTEFTSYNNGGNGVNVFAYKGTNDGNNHYTISLPLPDDTATAVAAGTARVISVGQVKEPLLEVKWATDPRPAVQPEVLANRVNVVVQNAYMELALSGTLTPRRTIVTTEKCNACHGALGTTSGANTLANAFHGGARNRVEACVLCHDVNRASSSVMTNGLPYFESFQFKRLIHGIHGSSRRTYPYSHGNTVVGAFGKDGLLTADGLLSSVTALPAGAQFVPYVTATVVAAGTPFASNVHNYAAEVAWPGVGINCNVCHVNDSYKVDRGPLGATVAKPLIGSPLAVDPNPMNWMVISPKAASCTACHDSPKALAHVTSFGNATFANRTQAQSIQTEELCADCHGSGGFKGVDIVHGQK